MTAKNEFGDEEELLAEFERVGQRMAEGDRDPKPGEIAQCFRCGKFAMIGEDLQLRMPTADEQLAIDTNAHLTESQIGVQVSPERATNQQSQTFCKILPHYNNGIPTTRFSFSRIKQNSSSAAFQFP